MEYKKDFALFEKAMHDHDIIYLYHFTDRDNLPSINMYRGLYSWYYCLNHGIQIKRPGGNDLSRELDSNKGLQNYVRLSFKPYPPMLFVAIKKGRIPNPVILKINPYVIYWKSTKFSNQNAASNSARIGDQISDFDMIDFDLAKSSYDSSIHNEDDKKFIQAEVLVEEHIPLEYIINFSDVYKF
ncbi:DarT ssDNA thymidine ADP-ribosyltransferase family protein [Methanosarcina hadiensis]|uniref:DarT ssDNA thymidine ADP-ribosyltransferase family protein n=1 Tax=Methanosarcina hadiensis TaxID=3078083 RepID=UPI003977C51B